MAVNPRLFSVNGLLWRVGERKKMYRSLRLRYIFLRLWGVVSSFSVNIFRNPALRYIFLRSWGVVYFLKCEHISAPGTTIPPFTLVGSYFIRKVSNYFGSRHYDTSFYAHENIFVKSEYFLKHSPFYITSLFGKLSQGEVG